MHYDIDDPRRGDGALGSSNAHVEASRGPGVSQELVTAAVLDALSNPDVIRRLVAAVSPGTSEASGTSSSVAAADDKFFSLYSCVLWREPACPCIGHCSLVFRSFHAGDHASLIGAGLAGAYARSRRQRSSHCCCWFSDVFEQERSMHNGAIVWSYCARLPWRLFQPSSDNGVLSMPRLPAYSPEASSKDSQVGVHQYG